MTRLGSPYGVVLPLNAAPSGVIVPDFPGQLAVDLSTGDLYVSTGIAATDWVAAGGGGGSVSSVTTPDVASGNSDPITIETGNAPAGNSGSILIKTGDPDAGDGVGGSITLEIGAFGDTPGAIEMVNEVGHKGLRFQHDGMNIGVDTTSFIGSGGNPIAFYRNTGAVPRQTVDGALSAVTDAAAKAVLTSLIAALAGATGVNLIADGTT